jgi:hypothetical protein
MALVPVQIEKFRGEMSMKFCKMLWALALFAVESPGQAHPFSLIFEHVGDTYTLHRIWASQHYGRELFQSNGRKTLVARGANYVEVGAE